MMVFHQDSMRHPIHAHAQVKTLTWVKSWTFGSWAWTPRGAGFWWPPAASVPRRPRRAAQRPPNARGASATWFRRSQHVWFVWSKNSQNIREEWVLIHPHMEIYNIYIYIDIICFFRLYIQPCVHTYVTYVYYIYIINTYSYIDLQYMIGIINSTCKWNISWENVYLHTHTYIYIYIIIVIIIIYIYYTPIVVPEEVLGWYISILIH